MYKIHISYYPGELAKRLYQGKARQNGTNPFFPFKIMTEATYAIVPRPGDHVFFKLHGKYAKFFGEPNEEGFVEKSGVVQWLELTDGSENLFIVVTDDGHKGYGAYDGDFEADLEKLVNGGF